MSGPRLMCAACGEVEVGVFSPLCPKCQQADSIGWVLNDNSSLAPKVGRAIHFLLRHGSSLPGDFTLDEMSGDLMIARDIEGRRIKPNSSALAALDRAIDAAISHENLTCSEHDRAISAITDLQSLIGHCAFLLKCVPMLLNNHAQFEAARACLARVQGGTP